MITVILPTFNETENIKRIVPAISRVFHEENMEGEIIVVDDNSPDGTAETASALADEFPVRVHVRKNERGLSKAVMEGFSLAERGHMHRDGCRFEPSGRENPGPDRAYTGR